MINLLLKLTHTHTHTHKHSHTHSHTHAHIYVHSHTKHICTRTHTTTPQRHTLIYIYIYTYMFPFICDSSDVGDQVVQPTDCFHYAVGWLPQKCIGLLTALPSPPWLTFAVLCCLKQAFCAKLFAGVSSCLYCGVVSL